MADGNGPTFGGNGGSTASVNGPTLGGDDVIRIDPGAIDATTGTETPSVGATPGRGPNGRKLNKDGTERKAKGAGRTSASTTAASSSLPVEALAASIIGTHALLSATLKVPELSLDPREAAQLASALANLQRFYPMVVTEKALAWGQVFSALGLVYGTRIAAIGARKAAERKQSPHAQPSATVLRPNFQQAQRPPQTPQPVAATPDGDPAPGAAVPGAQPRNAGDAIFANTPPELM